MHSLQCLERNNNNASPFNTCMQLTSESITKIGTDSENPEKLVSAP